MRCGALHGFVAAAAGDLTANPCARVGRINAVIPVEPVTGRLTTPGGFIGAQVAEVQRQVMLDGRRFDL